MKRLFFAMEVVAPWPHELPSGRLLKEEDRHMTIAFLGDTDLANLLLQLKSLTVPPLKVGLIGKFDRPLFLPERDPHVVAWHIEWLEESREFTDFLTSFVKWLKELGYMKNEKERDFLPHVTVCRSPFDQTQWQKSFHELPTMITGLSLYESMGNLNYEKRWSLPFFPPFIEIEHTADIAFEVYGQTIQQLYDHAQAALAFKYPPLLSYLPFAQKVEDIDDVIISLNKLITQLDADKGSPFKAVSFHDQIVAENQILKWEMIVDV